MRLLFILSLLLFFVSCEESKTVEPSSSVNAASGLQDDFSDLKKNEDENCDLEEEKIDTSKPFKLQGGDTDCEVK